MPRGLLKTKILPLNLSVPQAQARTPQGLGAEVGGRETGEAPRDLARGSVAGKAAGETRVPLAAGLGTVKWRERVTWPPYLSI